MMSQLARASDSFVYLLMFPSDIPIPFVELRRCAHAFLINDWSKERTYVDYYNMSGLGGEVNAQTRYFKNSLAPSAAVPLIKLFPRG